MNWRKTKCTIYAIYKKVNKNIYENQFKRAFKQATDIWYYIRYRVKDAACKASVWTFALRLGPSKILSFLPFSISLVVASDTLISACPYKWKASLRLHRSVAPSQIFIISDAGCPLGAEARKDATLRRCTFLRRCEPLNARAEPHPIRDTPAVVWSPNMFEQRSLSCL